jgi:uncharacterized protein
MGIESAAAPVKLEERIDTLDLLRGVAICGILLMNIPFMGMIGELDLPAFPARWNASWILWGIQQVFFEGTMRGLFTMLFGAGMLLMLRRVEGSDPRVAPFDVWTRRCIALMVLGVIQWAVFFWPGEILYLYGISGLFLLALRTARPRTLLIVAALLLAGLSWKAGDKAWHRATTLQSSIQASAAKAAGKKLTEEQEKAIKAATKTREAYHPAAKDVAKEKTKRTHLPSLWGWSWGVWWEYNIGADVWDGVLESVGFMAVGMALYRMGVLTGAASGATYAWMMAIGYGAGLGIRLFFLWFGSRTGYDLDIAKIIPAYSAFKNVAYEPARLLITMGHVGLLVTLWRAGALGRAVTLRALGRMALTVYSLQSILTSVLFYGFGYVGAFDFAGLMLAAGLIWIATALFCRFWLARHAMGPAEAFLRAVAYQSFRRRQRPAVEATLATAPAI